MKSSKWMLLVSLLCQEVGKVKNPNAFLKTLADATQQRKNVQAVRSELEDV